MDDNDGIDDNDNDDNDNDEMSEEEYGVFLAQCSEEEYETFLGAEALMDAITRARREGISHL